MTDITICQAGNGTVEVRVAQDTVGLWQEQVNPLFGRERSVISEHLRNVFAEGEREEESNVQNLHILPRTGKPVRSSTTTSMSSSRWVTGSKLLAST